MARAVCDGPISYTRATNRCELPSVADFHPRTLNPKFVVRPNRSVCAGALIILPWKPNRNRPLKPMHGYWLLCIPGVVLPLSSLVVWLRDNGFNTPQLVAELFATRIGGFFGWDVIVSAVVLLLFVLVEVRRLEIKHWWLSVIVVLGVGVSLGFPRC